MSLGTNFLDEKSYQMNFKNNRLINEKLIINTQSSHILKINT